LAQQDQLQPSLLDRLTDEEPQKKEESRDRRVMSLRRLRDAVMRDLAWLLNTDDLSCTEDLEAYPMIAQSTLNYGRPPMAGHTLSRADAKTVERSLHRSICNFEPRITASTLKVRAILSDEKMNANALAFDIEGQLWAQPAPLRLMLRTQVDLETGDVTVSDRGSG